MTGRLGLVTQAKPHSTHKLDRGFSDLAPA